MTSLGGTTIGEAMHRAAIMVRDNEGTGVGRGLREFAAFLLDPVGGFNRAARGEMSKVGPNPENRFPKAYATSINVGFRAIGEERVTNAEQTTGYFLVNLLHGDPMTHYERPFDAFQLNFQLNGKDEPSIGVFQIHGTLYGKELKKTDKSHHVFSIEQLFDYVQNNTYEIGSQAFGFSLRSRWPLSEKLAIRTLLQPNATVLSGIISEYAGFTGRTYDFGAGFGLRLVGALESNGLPVLRLGYRGFYQHTLSGAKGNQIVHFGFARGQFNITHTFGVTADYILYLRNSFYDDFPDVHRRNPEFRLGGIFQWRGP